MQLLDGRPCLDFVHVVVRCSLYAISDTRFLPDRMVGIISMSRVRIPDAMLF